MPSSLTEVLPSTSVCSTCPPVSVCGTVAPRPSPFGCRQRLFSAVQDQPVRLGVAPAPSARLSVNGTVDLPAVPPYRLGGCCHPRAYLPASPHHSQSRSSIGRGRDGTLRPLSITCASRPRLRPASPAADQHGCGTLGHSVGGIRTPLALLMPTFALPAPPRSLPLPLRRRRGRSPTTCRQPHYTAGLTHIRGVGDGLSPGGLSAPRHSRPVSYYALFQGWLLLSQPPGCLCAATPLPTEPGLRDLSRRSGLFPSRPRILASAVSLPWSPRLGYPRLLRDDSSPGHSSFGSGW